MSYKVSNYDYFLPKELIAQFPLKKRDSARLLVLDRRKKSISHENFSKFRGYLKKDDLLVLNNTKVLACRLLGRRKTGGKVEIFLLKDKGNSVFEAYIKPSRVKIGEEVILDGSKKASIVVTGKNEINFKGLLAKDIYGLGQMPLPPYIKRQVRDSDNAYYQTVYASCEGALAAPTAGLHFTRQILKNVEKIGAKLLYLTLHVGPGTFKPVKCADIREHKIDPEYFEIAPEAEVLLKDSLEAKKRVIAVGTTSCRALEAYARGAKSGYTDIFIYPGFKFKIVDGLLTNFHLPKSTLFMLVSAFAGEKLIKKAYQEAIEKKYRFYSYGDAMLIL